MGAESLAKGLGPALLVLDDGRNNGSPLLHVLAPSAGAKAGPHNAHSLQHELVFTGSSQLKV